MPRRPALIFSNFSENRRTYFSCIYPCSHFCDWPVSLPALAVSRSGQRGSDLREPRGRYKYPLSPTLLSLALPFLSFLMLYCSSRYIGAQDHRYGAGDACCIALNSGSLAPEGPWALPRAPAIIFDCKDLFSLIRCFGSVLKKRTFFGLM